MFLNEDDLQVVETCVIYGELLNVLNVVLLSVLLHLPGPNNVHQP